jgi:hypothetical protein
MAEIAPIRSSVCHVDIEEGDLETPVVLVEHTLELRVGQSRAVIEAIPALNLVSGDGDRSESRNLPMGRTNRLETRQWSWECLDSGSDEAWSSLLEGSRASSSKVADSQNPGDSCNFQ